MPTQKDSYLWTWYLQIISQHVKQNIKNQIPHWSLRNSNCLECNTLNKRKNNTHQSKLTSFFFLLCEKKNQQSGKFVTLRVNTVMFGFDSLFSFQKHIFFFFSFLSHLIFWKKKGKVYTFNEAIFLLVVIIDEKPFLLVKGYILDSLLQYE